MKVHVLAGARADFQEIRGSVRANFGESVWSTGLKALSQTLRSIERHPLSGSIVPEIEEFGLATFRQRLSGQTRVVYQIRGDDVYVHAFIHTKRDLTSILYKRLIKT